MRWAPADYRSPDAFAERVLELSRRAVAGGDGVPTLVAFPELVGVPLLLTATGDQAALAADTLETGLLRVARRDAAAWIRSALRHRHLGLGAIYAHYAPEVYRAYRDAFGRAARETGAVIVAGSAFLPDVDEEPLAGVHASDARTSNVSLAFGPHGGVLGRWAKVHLTPGHESRVGLRRGRSEDLPVIETEVGRLAVTVCLDGFYDALVGRLDGLGAQVLVQPSANMAAWDRPWPGDPTRREGEVWLGDGVRARLQGRAHLRYAVNPMMVGDAYGLRPRGRSSVSANVAATGLSGTMPEELPGLLAIAPDPEEEAIVRVQVPFPG